MWCHSVVKLYPTLCDPMDCSMPGLPVTIPWSLLKLMSIVLVMPSNHPILCCPLLLSSIFPSIRVFSNEPALHHIRWPKHWSFSFSISISSDIQHWFPLGWMGLIFLLFKGLSRVSFSSAVLKTCVR